MSRKTVNPTLLQVLTSEVGVIRAAHALELIVLYTWWAFYKEAGLGFEAFASDAGCYARRTAYRRLDILKKGFPETSLDEVATRLWETSTEVVRERNVGAAASLEFQIA